MSILVGGSAGQVIFLCNNIIYCHIILLIILDTFFIYNTFIYFMYLILFFSYYYFKLNYSGFSGREVDLNATLNEEIEQQAILSRYIV